MSSGKQGTQMEAPGMPASDLAFFDAKVNEAVLLVSEAEEALRRARKAERLARAGAAEARRRLG